jgi:hypothetical protein
MPLDNSNTQSFRTHRLRCKASAATPGPITNEQTTPESSFVDYKLGKMSYIVQPASGGPVTTDAGCCSDSITTCNALCTTVVDARYMLTSDYNTLVNDPNYSLDPLSSSYTFQYVAVILFKACTIQQRHDDIESIQDRDTLAYLNFSGTHITSDVNMSLIIPGSGICYVIALEFMQDYMPGINNHLIINGVIKPINCPILN